MHMKHWKIGIFPILPIFSNGTSNSNKFHWKLPMHITAYYLYYISVLNIALETILKKVNSEDYIEILLTWITAPQNKETRY
ncbi:unnamed protein product [Rhizophagus irregularis]|nr:unnamed protein product [Rhizophagus irregularis]